MGKPGHFRDQEAEKDQETEGRIPQGCARHRPERTKEVR
jgi:hypothetical protein